MTRLTAPKRQDELGTSWAEGVPSRSSITWIHSSVASCVTLTACSLPHVSTSCTQRVSVELSDRGEQLGIERHVVIGQYPLGSEQPVAERGVGERFADQCVEVAHPDAELHMGAPRGIFSPKLLLTTPRRLPGRAACSPP